VRKEVERLVLPARRDLENGRKNYTPEEFARKRREFGIVRTAVEEGVRVDEPLSPEGRSKAKRRPKRSAGGAKAFDEAVRQKRRRGDGAR
jgi:hypothetical protein